MGPARFHCATLLYIGKQPGSWDLNWMYKINTSLLRKTCIIICNVLKLTQMSNVNLFRVIYSYLFSSYQIFKPELLLARASTDHYFFFVLRLLLFVCAFHSRTLVNEFLFKNFCSRIFVQKFFIQNLCTMVSILYEHQRMS